MPAEKGDPQLSARKYGTTNPVLIEARVYHDPYDEFAWVQDWRFAIAEHLHFRLGERVPGFQPGGMENPPAEDESFAYEMLRGQTDVEALRYALRILDRYREWLRIAGKDY